MHLEFKYNLSQLKGFFLLIFFSISICHASTTSSYASPRTWGSIEYLYWWTQNSPLDVPLVTKNNQRGTFAKIGEPGTQIIFGSGSKRNVFKLNGSSGLRLTLGTWLDEAHHYGLEGVAFTLSENKNTFTATSVGNHIPVIDVPFFSTQASSENVLVGGRPNTITDSNTFQPFSIELNGLYHVSNTWILSAGFRFIHLDEKVTLKDAVFNTASLPPNSVLTIQDHFSTINNFYGLQIGARSHFNYQKIIFDLKTTLAFGENNQKLNIKGQTMINQRILQRTGLFAEPSNIGIFKNNQFAIVPELEVKIGYWLTQVVHPFITYNCFYINKVIRPGQQIDRHINLSQNSLLGGTGVLSGPALPSPHFHNTSLWLQGVSAGIEWSI